MNTGVIFVVVLTWWESLESMLIMLIAEFVVAHGPLTVRFSCGGMMTLMHEEKRHVFMQLLKQLQPLQQVHL